DVDIEVDPLLENPEAFGIILDKPSREGLAQLNGKYVTAEDYLIDVEREFLPKLNELDSKIEGFSLHKNPVRDLIKNILLINVVAPAQKILNNFILCPADVANRIISDLMLLIDVISALLDDPKKDAALIRKVMDTIEGTVAHINIILNAIPGGESQINLGKEYLQVKKMLFHLVEGGILLNFREIALRDDKEVAQARKESPYPHTRLKRLLFLCETFRQENIGNANAVSGVQFLMQVITRIKDDNELMKFSGSLKPVIIALYEGGMLPMSGIASIYVKKDMIDEMLAIVLPEKVLTKKELLKATPLARKIEPILQVLEAHLTKDPKSFGQHNLLIGCMIENIRHYLRAEGNAKNIKKNLTALRNHFKRLQDVVRKSIITPQAAKELASDPLLKAFLEDDTMLTGALDLFYREEDSEKEVAEGDAIQLNNLKEVIDSLILESKDAKSKKMLLAVKAVLEGFRDDNSLYSNFSKFQKIIEPILFGEKYVAIKMSPEGKGLMKKLIFYVPEKQVKADPKAAKGLADDMGDIEGLATLGAGDALAIAAKHPEIMVLTNVVGALTLKLEEKILEHAPEELKRTSIAAFRFTMKNYENYLVEKYKNSTSNLLLTSGFPPRINQKNIDEESKKISDIATGVFSSPLLKDLIGPGHFQIQLTAIAKVALTQTA
ncbi:hypothetical protein HN709_03025, partial [Candidatus Peregrinibacteria bacterium]|nr:hypothetical protein [Candidatus Peregrinibacteria bacterium]